MNRKQLLKKIGVLSALPMPDKKALLAGVRARAGLPDGAARTAAPPSEPPCRLRALRFAGQAAAVAVVLALLAATLLFALYRTETPSPGLTTGSGQLAVTLNSRTGDRTERTVPMQILPFDRIGADEAARAESLADTPAKETAGAGYAFEYEEDGGAEVTKIVKYENGGVAWRYTLSGRQLLSRYRECKAGVLFLYHDAQGYSGEYDANMLLLSLDGERIWSVLDAFCYYSEVYCEEDRLLVWGSDPSGGFCAVYDYNGALVNKIRGDGYGDVRKVVAVGDGYAAIFQSGSSLWVDAADWYDVLVLFDSDLSVTDAIIYTTADGSLYLSDLCYREGKLYVSAGLSGDGDRANGPAERLADPDDWTALSSMTEAELTARLAERCCAYLLVCTPDGLPEQGVSAPGCLPGAVSAEAGALLWRADSLQSAEPVPEASSYSFRCLVANDRFTFSADGAAAVTKTRVGYRRAYFL